MKFYLLPLAVLGIVGFSSCNDEELISDSPLDGPEVKARITITREDFTDESRTVLNEVDGKLKNAWTDGDGIMVTNTKGQKLGIMYLTGGAGTNAGSFEGTLSGLRDGSRVLNFYYLGHKVDPANITRSTLYYDFSEQTGTRESLSNYDLMMGSVEVSIIDGLMDVPNLKIARQFAYAHFTLDMPAGVKVNGETVTVSGANLKDAVNLDLATVTYTAEEGAIDFPNSNGDLYICMIPSEAVELNFSVTVNGVEYTGALGARNWTANSFVRKAHQQGVAVPMTAPTPDVDHALNPLLKWAEENLETEMEETNVFAAAGTKGSLYQWGRNHGYEDYKDAMGPLTWLNSYLTGIGRPTLEDDQLIYPYAIYGNDEANCGTAIHLDILSYESWLGYQWATSYSAYCEAPLMYESAEDLQTDPYKFVMDARIGDENKGDYWVFNEKPNPTWMNRALNCGYSEGDPSPEGWMLPFEEDWAEILPTAALDGTLKANSTEDLTSVMGNLMELRTTADGVPYAIRWVNEITDLKIQAICVPASFTESQLSSIDWDTGDNVVTRLFPYTGVIKAFVNEFDFDASGLSDPWGHGWKLSGKDCVARPFPLGDIQHNTDHHYVIVDYDVVKYYYDIYGNIVGADADPEYDWYYIYAPVLLEDYSASLGGYWVGDAKKCVKFVDNAISGVTAQQSMFVMDYYNPQDGLALRCIKDPDYSPVVYHAKQAAAHKANVAKRKALKHNNNCLRVQKHIKGAKLTPNAKAPKVTASKKSNMLAK